MTELLPPQDIEPIRAQFNDLGHVGITSSFDSEFLERAKYESDRLVKNQRYYEVNNTLKYVINRYDKKTFPIFDDLMQGVHDQVNAIDETLWSTTPNYIEHHEMAESAVGQPHRDYRLLGAVVMINLHGTSRFIVHEEPDVNIAAAEYAVGEGDMVIQSPTKRLYHQGIATAKRTYLTISHMK